ncbi:MAG: phosphate ABC transporter, permease protein PstA, partial [Verrucomicrobiales bacterium]|nr:phosphate ABC transporter, permease protein PstA [Verrucomicrobiales bacterium]
MNRFKARPSTLSSVEKLVKIILWCATYFVIACALGIFADIFVKGAPVVFQKTPPFINVPFLTELPETLVIFEPGPGETLKLNEKAFDRF